MSDEILDLTVERSETVAQSKPDHVVFLLGCPACGKVQQLSARDLTVVIEHGPLLSCPYCQRGGFLPSSLTCILQPLRDAIIRGEWEKYVDSLGPQYGWIKQSMRVLHQAPEPVRQITEGT